MPSPSSRRWLRIAIGLAIAAVSFLLLLMNVRWVELREAIAQARLPWVVAALGTTLLTLGSVTWRWRLLLWQEPASSARGLRWRALWDAVVIGQAVNIVFPLRFGEGARVAVTCAKTGRPAGGVTVAMAFERALDVGAFGAMLLFVAAAGRMPQAFDGALPSVFAVAVVSIVSVLLMVRLLPGVLRWARARLRAGSRPARWLAAQESSARAAWHGLARGRRLPALVAMTAVGLLSSAATNLLIFRAFDLGMPAISAFVLLAVLQIGTAVVSVPGNVGVFHYLTVLTLGAWQVPAAVALAAAVVLHAVSLGTRVLLGVIAGAFTAGPAAPSGR